MKRLVWSLSLCAILLSACSKEKNPVSSPAPTMSGKWDYTITGQGGTLTGTMDVTEDKGTLNATVTLQTATVVMTGTCTSAGGVTLAGTEPGYRHLISGTASSDRKTFSGKWELWDTSQSPESYMGYLSMTATKR